MLTTIGKRVGAILHECYSGPSLLWQIAAAGLTYVIVVSGLDWYWFVNTRTPLLQSYLFPAAVLGGLLPIILPIVLLSVGKARGRAAAYALVYAGALALFISSFYKFFTGRVPPPFRAQAAQALIDNSHQFEFGLFRDGVFWGWPSSHTTVAFAMAVTLFILYRKNPYIAYGSLLVALYIGIGVSTNIHWLSEFVAGALIGTVIGRAVARTL